MASVAVTELNANLAKYLRMARRGVEVYVLERGIPIARLVAMPNAPSKDAADLDRLVSAGIARRGTGGARAVVKRRLPASVDLLQAVIDEREESRRGIGTPRRRC